MGCAVCYKDEVYEYNMCGSCWARTCQLVLFGKVFWRFTKNLIWVIAS